MRLMVYSHDAFGLGNIRRMLAICEHLLSEINNLSILLISGSPMLQGFRLPPGLDYIKLPCLNRGEVGKVSVKYLGTDVNETVKLRSDLILSAAVNFKPDLLMVDKKPYGLKNELQQTIHYLNSSLPQTKLVLLLRDILDTPEKTVLEWQSQSYYETVEKFYDRILVVGMPEVFDVCRKYQFPTAIAHKTSYCGYIRREAGSKSAELIRQELKISADERLVLVTPGGGQDGYHLIDTYLAGLDVFSKEEQFTIKSLVLCGPEMCASRRKSLFEKADNHPQVEMREFTDDLMSYMTAADAVVGMGGYNTVCEILSARKPATIVPRFKPSKEQLMRAARISRLGLCKMIHPQHLTPDALANSLLSQLSFDQLTPKIQLDLNALPRISHYIGQLLSLKVEQSKVFYISSPHSESSNLVAALQ
ncbi:glycosyltransferase [Mastigocoleus sp. MO_188.B34]|uniref:glycosyltransferase family protein n=1 Tax=Mastigocoleus sp. MO_188.B34 TaxID=3036635 RepID=UPI002628C5A4|nr:glycosyltransferase [Mastigocoleus sp. MO_188.B34]MDJ0695068.1 glycosyltransferase [Mastigocoleus sp. MO_188.B34]